uniref:SAWADEE domain-containing protein n=1 Tax=Solanum tuberosum TaxID=4113 RepID=M1BLD2_SOLTU
MYKYSPDKLFAGQKDPALSDLEFEARSSKDGAWYDIDTFIAHRFLNSEEPEGKDEEKYLEAQVIEIQKKLHDIRGCRCLFVIRYTGDDTEETIRLRRMCVRPSILGRP